MMMMMMLCCSAVVHFTYNTCSTVSTYVIDVDDDDILQQDNVATKTAIKQVL